MEDQYNILRAETHPPSPTPQEISFTNDVSLILLLGIVVLLFLLSHFASHDQ